MEIFMRGNKVEITDAMSSYVKEKLSKLDKYISDENGKANVLVKVRNYTQKVEVTISKMSDEEIDTFLEVFDQCYNRLLLK